MVDFSFPPPLRQVGARFRAAFGYVALRARSRCSLILAWIHAKTPEKTKGATSILRSFIFAPSKPHARAKPAWRKTDATKSGRFLRFSRRCAGCENDSAPPSLRYRRLFQLKKQLCRMFDSHLPRPAGYIAHHLCIVQFPQSCQERMHPRCQRLEVIAKRLDNPFEMP